MKKLLTLLVAILLIAVAVFAVACGGSNVVGKYKFKAMYEDGKIYKVGDTNEYGGAPLIQNSYVLELYSDNTLEFIITEGTTTTTLRGVWYQSGDYSISADVDGINIYANINGNNIIFEYNYDVYIILSK